MSASVKVLWLLLLSWSLLIQVAFTDCANTWPGSLVAVSLRSTEEGDEALCESGVGSSAVGLSSELDAWWGETSSNYRTDALNEVSAGFPAGSESSALGQGHCSHWIDQNNTTMFLQKLKKVFQSKNSDWPYLPVILKQMSSRTFIYCVFKIHFNIIYPSNTLFSCQLRFCQLQYSS